MPKKTRSSSSHSSRRRASGESVPAPCAVPRKEPRTHRELAQAISAECDLVQVGCGLLQSGSERGAAVRARMFETVANWQFGKSNSAAGGSGVRVIWDMPGPPHEHRDD